MKALILVLLLGVPATAQDPDLKAKIKTFRNNKRFDVEYDRFKDQTWIKVGPFAVVTEKPVRTLGMDASIVFSGEKQSKPINTAFLRFAAYSREWKFLDSRSLYAIVDGERLSLGEGIRDSRISSYAALLKEELSFLLPLEILSRFSEAKSVELRVGYFELKLKEEHQIAFRDLLSLLRQ